MKNQKKITIITSISLAVVMVASAIALFASPVKGGEVLDQDVARRDKSASDDGMVYIDPDIVALAGQLSGTVESQAAARSAFDKINEQRTAAGLGTLTWSNGLEQASEVRAVEASELWSHNRPDGTEYWTVNSNIVYGENLAKGYSTADEAVTAWMNSYSHRDNILYSDFKTAAIAIHISNGQYYWANEFGY